MEKLIILLVAFIPLLAGAQAVQYGRTLEYKGRQVKSALPNVSIRLGDVETASDNTGNFKLVFRTLSKGDKIPYGRIEKPGYVIFNKQAYDEWHIYSDNKPFNIVLCKEESFKSSVDLYYHIGMNSYKQQYEKELKQAESLKNNLDAYHKELKEINDRYNNLLKQLDKYADLFARIDESEINNVEEQAITLAKQGKLDEAIKILESLNLGEKLEKQGTKLSTAKKLLSDAQKDVDSEISTAKTLIKVYALQGGKENFEKSCVLYEQIANADTTNFNNVYECALFLYTQNQYPKAEYYYKILLQTANSEVNRANVLNGFGNLYCKSNNYPESEKSYQEALTIRRKLAASNPGAYEPDLAKSLNNLRVLCSTQKKYSEAVKYGEESIELYTKLNDEKSLSSVEGNLSYNLIFLKRFSEAEQYAVKALSIDSTQIWIKTNLITSVLFQGRYAEAEKMALEIKDKIWEENKPLRDNILEDLKAFEKDNIIPQEYINDVEKLRKVLQ